MASLEELRAERLKKLELWRAAGPGIFPTETGRDRENAEVLAKFSALAKSGKVLNLAGRVRSLRIQGGLIFFDFDDGTALLQALLKRDEPPAGGGEAAFELFRELVDIGDFVRVRGSLFTTKRGQPTLAVSGWRLLTKSLRPLPDQWHGLQDPEERFRHRYLDSLMSPAVKARFVIRSQIIAASRAFLNQRDFLEVETPMLQAVPGGASAAPFVTHHQALNLDLYLRVAPELFLKQMVIGGFPKIYELGRSFRNEGVDVTHNPEFTSLEVYESFAAPADGRRLVSELLLAVLKKVLGGATLTYQKQKITFPKTIPTISFADLLKSHALINDLELPERELELKANQFGVKVAPGESRFKILDHIYKKVCRPKLIQPVFIVDYPAASAPLAKRQTARPELVDRFQLVAGGLELVNGFAELNDPLEQAERFAEQEAARAAGDREAQIKDESYLTALEHGLPPTTGWGLGVDRLVMLLTDAPNIREVIYFPTLRPNQ